MTKAVLKQAIETKSNPMREVAIEKVILSAGATGDNLKKAKKLLELITEKKAQIQQSSKRIPNFNVSPGMEVGVRITLRGEEALQMLKRLLGAVDNILKKKQITSNHFSFGIKEYIEIPGVEYQRDLGIRGFNATVVFVRPGLRVQRKKIKSGNIPVKQHVTAQEIMNYMEGVFKTTFN